MLSLRLKSLLVYLFCLALVLATWAAQAEERPRIGLVLGGGGAAGVAHVGVLKVLEEQHIPIDVIAGNSMGAVIGSLYASGKSAAELEQLVRTLDWQNMFRDEQARNLQSFQQKRENSGFFNKFSLGVGGGSVKLPTGIVEGQKLMFELRRLLAPVEQVTDFDRLPIPFRAVATDIESGEAVVLRNGNLPTAVRASMAIPGLFSPVKIGGHLLVDGFVSNNLPVDVARQMGADILIVVNIPTELKKQGQLDSGLAVSLQAMQLLMLKTSATQLASLTPKDILIEPPVGEIGNLEFDKVAQTIPLGEKGARQKLGALQALARQAKVYAQAAPARKIPGKDRGAVKISRIEIQNDSRLDDAILFQKLGVKAGDQLDTAALQRGLENIHSLGYFGLVDYSLQSDPRGGVNLKVIAQKEATGTQRLRFGFTLEDDFNGNTKYQAGVQHTLKGINAAGGSWKNSAIIGDTIRLESSLHQPLQSHNDLFVNPRIWHEQKDFFVTDADKRLAEVRGNDVGVQVDVGKDIQNWGEMRAGVFYKNTSPNVKTGQVDLPEGSIKTVGVQAQYNVDTLDDYPFPQKGGKFSAKYTQGVKSMGSDIDYQRLQASGSKVWTRGKHRVMARAEVGSTFSDDTVLTEQLSIGGLGRLSGIPRDQVFGNHLGVAAAAYTYKLTEAPGVAKVYAGGSLEAGNVWRKQEDIKPDNVLTSGSVFLGADTPVGPAYLGVGKTEGYEPKAFLYLGQDF